ncbi:outer membrane beta-barrel protein [Halomonas piscis]|uniref:Outer membrane beta-barrel protein n=1 Tax=Halomonas piscis TaxID=3031727 RepID=A0ABY9YYM1_9GAMM|nr:outer membrane beta-barrel protein [Halomonas piscis]WNK19722.1 outer membrane beta-barrel protein [Halomonas piscis]
MKRLLAAAVTALMATTAAAQSHVYNPDEGPYLGAGIGHAKMDNDILNDLDRWGASTDDSDTAYKLFAGYQFNPHFAVEAGYVDFGEFTASSRYANGTMKADGFTAALVGKLPIEGGFGVYGKLGMIAWDGERSSTLTAKESEDGTDPFYGAGLEYVVDQIVMRAEFERYDISEGGEDFETDLISASLGYRF